MIIFSYVTYLLPYIINIVTYSIPPSQSVLLPCWLLSRGGRGGVLWGACVGSGSGCTCWLRCLSGPIGGVCFGIKGGVLVRTQMSSSSPSGSEETLGHKFSGEVRSCVFISLMFCSIREPRVSRVAGGKIHFLRRLKWALNVVKGLLVSVMV